MTNQLDCNDRFEWTTEKEAVVKATYESREPTRIAAASIGCTKEAFIGKARRMGLSKPNAVRIAERAVQPRPTPRDTWQVNQQKIRRGLIGLPPPRDMTIAPPTAPGAVAVQLHERTGCCFPVNNGKPYLFCNEATEAGSYCTFHKDLMFTCGKRV